MEDKTFIVKIVFIDNDVLTIPTNWTIPTESGLNRNDEKFIKIEDYIIQKSEIKYIERYPNPNATEVEDDLPF